MLVPLLLALHSKLPPGSSGCESWCNEYSKANPMCAACDCDNLVMRVDDAGAGLPTPHCARPEDIADIDKKPPPPPSPQPPPPASPMKDEWVADDAKDSSGCARFCNVYTKDNPLCSACDCEALIMVKDANTGKESEHCAGPNDDTTAAQIKAKTTSKAKNKKGDDVEDESWRKPPPAPPLRPKGIAPTFATSGQRRSRSVWAADATLQ